MADHPTIRTPEYATAICDALRDGTKSLRKVCAELNIDSSGVLQWALDDPDGFGQQYRNARYLGYLAMADDLVETAETPLECIIETEEIEGPSPDGGRQLLSKKIKRGDMVAHRKLIVDTKKWVLSRVLPKIYGDKVSIEHTGSVSLEDRLRAGRARVISE